MQFLTNITNNGRKNLCGRKKKLHKILDATFFPGYSLYEIGIDIFLYLTYSDNR
jgi:hypothetical protein